jgi:hypothetical protein
MSAANLRPDTAWQLPFNADLATMWGCLEQFMLAGFLHLVIMIIHVTGKNVLMLSMPRLAMDWYEYTVRVVMLVRFVSYLSPGPGCDILVDVFQARFSPDDRVRAVQTRLLGFAVFELTSITYHIGWLHCFISLMKAAKETWNCFVWLYYHHFEVLVQIIGVFFFYCGYAFFLQI